MIDSTCFDRYLDTCQQNKKKTLEINPPSSWYREWMTIVPIFIVHLKIYWSILFSNSMNTLERSKDEIRELSSKFQYFFFHLHHLFHSDQQ